MKRVWHTFRRVLPYLRPSWKLAVFSLVFTFLAAGLSLLLPWPLAIVFDSVLGNKPLPPVLAPLDSLGRFSLLALLALAGLGLTAALGVVGVLTDYVNTMLEQRLVLDFRSDIFRHAQRLSLAYHDRKLKGMFSAQINLQASGAGAIVVAIPPLLQALLTLVGMFAITYRINAQLALLALSVVPLVYYSTGYYARRIEPRLVKVRGMEGESLSIVHEAMAMLRVIVPFGREHHEYRRFREQGERAVAARVDLTVRQTLFSTVVSLITATGTALVLGFGAYQILQGKMSGGDLLVVITYVAAVYTPLQQITSTISVLQEQFVNVRGALELLDAEPEVEDAPGAYRVGRVEGNVAFEGVHFSYQGRLDTLKDVSFEARVGERIAIVGPTGAGKTTLTSLILRLYDPERGRILLDGIDIRKIKLKSLREKISIVMQEPLLFSGSILENIRYGRLEASVEEVEEAAKAANAHDFIMGLPEQYETKLGEGGSLLSGGERQRISVGRAFLKDAPILILDEPTSAIDSKTESVILDSLERLMVGRTTFMVAHRLSTVRNADRILVMDHGQLVEQGTHDELLEREGLYRQLFGAQTRQAPTSTRVLQAVSGGSHATNGEVEPAAQKEAQVHRRPLHQSGGAGKTEDSNPITRSEGEFVTASPNPVPAGEGPGTTEISWSVGGEGSWAQVYVSINGGPEKLFAGGVKGSQEAPWIQPNATYEFRMYAGKEHEALLDSVTLVRKHGDSAPTAKKPSKEQPSENLIKSAAQRTLTALPASPAGNGQRGRESRPVAEKNPKVDVGQTGLRSDMS